MPDELWKEAEDYWRRQLTDLPYCEIAPDHPLPAGGARGERATVSRCFGRGLSAAVDSLAAGVAVTPGVVLVSGAVALLHRYTGDTDLAIAISAWEREDPAHGGLVRVNVSDNPTFRALLCKVETAVSAARRYAFFPWEKIAGLSQTDRPRLCGLSVGHEDAGARLAGLSGESTSKCCGTGDLHVFMGRGEAAVHCEYDRALFDSKTIQELMAHLESLLSAAVADPDQNLSSYRLLTANQITMLLDRGCPGGVAAPADRCVHELFEQRVRLHPNRTAVLCGRAAVTYGELNQRANRMARYLRSLGLGRGERIGIQVQRSVEMLVSVLAVLKTGGCYVPLDPSFPAERLRFMAEDAGLALTIDDQWLHASRPEVTQQESDDLVNRATLSSPADIIYTSGSTGIPKGVEIHHGALVNVLNAVIRNPGIREDDTVLAVTTLSFDISKAELFGPLLAGARIRLATREEVADGLELRRIIEEGTITLLSATPATWRMLIEAGWKGTHTLRMFSTGEPLSRAMADQLLSRGVELWNLYGPTETTIWSSWRRITAGADPITVGGPAPNQSFYLLDAYGNLVPAGAPGELWIGGAGVSKGYRNRPELTAERFKPNPFGSGIIYRTGDRGRWRGDGDMEILGRMDGQVKIRGFRVELGEVEATMAACPGVRGAAAVVQGDTLAGYFLSNQVTPATEVTLRSHLSSKLPAYMVPSHLILLDEFPRTANGKLDRRALPDPKLIQRRSPAERELAADRMEAALTNIWELVLQRHPIHRTDNFFEIGGHSLVAARLFAQMEKQLGRTLPLATLFQAPTIEKLAAVLRDRGWTPPWSSLVPIRSSGSRPPFVFVHAIGGNVVNFAGFAAHFNSDQPLYGLQARGLDGKRAPHLVLEQMAADYIRDMKSVQPQGPYYLGGFSAGAVVAFEMARQLRSQGDAVPVLALLEGEMTCARSTTRAMHWWRTMLFNARYSAHVGFRTFVTKKLRNWRRRVRIRLLPWHDNPSLLDAEEAFMVALRAYRAQPYDGSAILFCTDTELRLHPDMYEGWSQYVRGGVEVQFISGDHETLLAEPQVGQLASILADRLDEAYAACTESGIPMPIETN